VRPVWQPFVTRSVRTRMTTTRTAKVAHGARHDDDDKKCTNGVWRVVAFMHAYQSGITPPPLEGERDEALYGIACGQKLSAERPAI